MTDCKKPGVAFWATVVNLVLSLLAYPFSALPAGRRKVGQLTFAAAGRASWLRRHRSPRQAGWFIQPVSGPVRCVVPESPNGGASPVAVPASISRAIASNGSGTRSRRNECGGSLGRLTGSAPKPHQFSRLMLMLRNSTGSLWPAKPK